MPIHREFLEMFRCPVGKVRLRAMTQSELAELNAAIAHGEATHASGHPVAGALGDGLVAADRTWAYRVSDGIPVLLPELAIRRDGDAAGAGAPAFRRGEDASTDERWKGLSLNWPGLRPPLRPGPTDVGALARLVDERVTASRTRRPRALLLGVTPEFATMRWPTGTRLLALDFCDAMIRNVWQAPVTARALVTRANWTTMPVCDEAFDVIVGDGNLTSLSYPGEYLAFASEIRRVLRDTGALVLRLFARPERAEPLAAIFDDLRNGRVGSMSLVPWRIAQALHGDLATGVRAGGVWEAWCEHVPEPEDLMRTLGWPRQALANVEWTRGGEYRMRFPTIREVEDLLAPDFVLTACHSPEYECGDRYPTVVFEPRRRS